MTSYYECHLTLEGVPATIKPLVEQIKWKFSCIDGDIVLGDGVKCYATRHFNARMPEADELKFLIDTAGVLQAQGISVIRRKIERVIYDDRSSKVQACDGAI